MTTAINTTIDAKIAESQRAIIQWTVGTMIALVTECLAIAGALVALR